MFAPPTNVMSHTTENKNLKYVVLQARLSQKVFIFIHMFMSDWKSLDAQKN